MNGMTVIRMDNAPRDTFEEWCHGGAMKDKTRAQKRYGHLIGRKLGSLVLVDLPEGLYRQRAYAGVFRCCCGTVKVYPVNLVVAGSRTNCGCKRPRHPNFRHGMQSNPSYTSWKGMLARCHNKNSKDYPRYGGRGISVCDRWRNSFLAFYEDMGERQEGMSIDRIDNDGDYEPENVRWACMTRQITNRRSSYTVRGGGKTYASMAEAARDNGVCIKTIQRWCDGYTDKRRGSHRPPKDGWSREKLYGGER